MGKPPLKAKRLQLDVRLQQRLGSVVSCDLACADELLAAGVAALILWPTLINIAMVIGSFPVVGMPLPLFSYGGSSIITTYASTGILLSIRAHRFTRAS